jgi:hypothetical protein
VPDPFEHLHEITEISLLTSPGAIWISGLRDDEIARVDQETLEVTRIRLPSSSSQVSIFGDEVWTLEAGTAARLDPQTGEIVESITGVDDDSISTWFVTDTALVVLDADGTLAETPRN